MNDLTKHCRYYKGEDACPQNILEMHSSSLWNYERGWATSEMHRNENNDNTLEYIHYGLKDFSADDGTPITLKAMLFNRYCHWSGGYGNETEGFKEWYNRFYLKSTENNL